MDLTDRYNDALREMIDAKIAGKEVVAGAEEEKPVVDIMTALKQSVAGGQCEFPKGLFFGGKQMEDGPRQYQAFVKERLAAAEKAIVIDVHTGLGKFAEDSLLVESEDFDRLRVPRLAWRRSGGSQCRGSWRGGCRRRDRFRANPAEDAGEVSPCCGFRRRNVCLDSAPG